MWFQAEEIFPVNRTPEVREQVFWIPVSQSYYELAQKIEVFALGAMDCKGHGQNISHLKLLNGEYYTIFPSTKLTILQFLCDDIMEGCCFTKCRKSFHVPCALSTPECRWDVVRI